MKIVCENIGFEPQINIVYNSQCSENHTLYGLSIRKTKNFLHTLFRFFKNK